MFVSELIPFSELKEMSIFTFFLARKHGLRTKERMMQNMHTRRDCKYLKITR